jgi:hypothetical protein
LPRRWRSSPWWWIHRRRVRVICREGLRTSRGWDPNQPYVLRIVIHVALEEPSYSSRAIRGWTGTAEAHDCDRFNFVDLLPEKLRGLPVINLQVAASRPPPRQHKVSAVIIPPEWLRVGRRERLDGISRNRLWRREFRQHVPGIGGWPVAEQQDYSRRWWRWRGSRTST